MESLFSLNCLTWSCSWDDQVWLLYENDNECIFYIIHLILYCTTMRTDRQERGNLGFWVGGLDQEQEWRQLVCWLAGSWGVGGGLAVVSGVRCWSLFGWFGADAGTRAPQVDSEGFG